MTSPLHEIHPVRQIPGEPRRRWFASDDLDLIVWYGPSAALVGFQLCYDKLHAERAVTWQAEDARLTHRAVDDGEDTGFRHKASPVLVPDGALDAAGLLARFLAGAGEVPADAREAVVRALQSAASRP